MVNAQEYINQKYPVNGTCIRKSDQENKDKKREDISELDLGKGKVGNSYFSEGKKLVGSLKLENFTNLRKLIISAHQLISLDVSDCPDLEELDCRNNQLNTLIVNGCSNLKKINCSNNNYLKELDLSTCVKLNEVIIENCPELTSETIKSELTFNKKKTKLIKGPIVTKTSENETRNILIIGITGNGKSTLANTLSDTSNDNKFGEKNSTTSVTKNSQESEEFEWEKDGKKAKYRIIDNIGFGDTNKISNDDILYKIGEGIYSAREGINQVLFVFKGRFAPEHIMAFNLFKDFIDETGITKFTTLVRTNFENFRTQQECEEDQKSLLKQNKELVETIKSCNGAGKIIYVNNPSLSVSNEEEKEANKKIREKSRKIVLDHLIENCQEIYKLEEWDDIYSKVAKYKETEKNLVKAKDGKEKLEKEKSNLFKELRIKLGLNVPGLPVGLEAAIEIIK